MQNARTGKTKWQADLKSRGSDLRNRFRLMPPVLRQSLWDHPYRVIANLNQSRARNDPRALIHMTMGNGKTSTASNPIYRLIAYAGARRILSLVDRRTPGRQASQRIPTVHHSRRRPPGRSGSIRSNRRRPRRA
jgi:type I site-specific restriction endonuclease